jgi:hypothetical protein
VATQDRATAEAPARRRPNWSLRTIVENVSGHPIAHFQDPPASLPARALPRTILGVATPTSGAQGALSGASLEGAVLDPVDAVYPPLIGPIGREYHGADRQHHTETLARHHAEPGSDARSMRAPGPLARPERIYLHYLLLHMDRLSDTALSYLGHAVEEERVHRTSAPRPQPPPYGGVVADP